MPRGFHQRRGGKIVEVMIAGPLRSGQIIVQLEFHGDRAPAGRALDALRVPDDGQSNSAGRDS